MNSLSFLDPLLASSRGPALLALARLHDEIDAEQGRFRAALDGSSATGQASPSCPPGCGRCCLGFTPDILPLEAEFIAAWLLAHGEPSPRASEVPGTCPWHDQDRPGANCSIYPARPLICRFFGFSPSLDRESRAEYVLCRHMSRPPLFPAPAEQRTLGADILAGLATRPEDGSAGADAGPLHPFVSMADWSRRLLALSPSEASDRHLLPEALRRAEARVALLVALSRHEDGSPRPVD